MTRYALAPQVKASVHAERHFRPDLRRLTPIILLLPLIGCAVVGDFDRPKISGFGAVDSSWVDTQAALSNGAPLSQFDLTEDERLLRDLASGLATSPDNPDRRHHVFVGGRRFVGTGAKAAPFDVKEYGAVLLATPYRSATARYSRLMEDTRNDIDRIEPFARVAHRIIDIDRKRKKSLAYISGLNEAEHVNALRRIDENETIIALVAQFLTERAAAYRYALERLVLETPSPIAVEAERMLVEFRSRIADIPGSNQRAIPSLVARRS